MENIDKVKQKIGDTTPIYIIMIKYDGKYFIETGRNGGIKSSQEPIQKIVGMNVSTAIHVTMLGKRGVLTSLSELTNIISTPYTVYNISIAGFSHFGIELEESIGKELYEKGYDLS